MASYIYLCMCSLSLCYAQVNAESKDPRAMKEEKSFEISISCKKARLPRGSGDVSYEDYPEIIHDIIAHASPTPTTSTGP